MSIKLSTDYSYSPIPEPSTLREELASERHATADWWGERIHQSLLQNGGTIFEHPLEVRAADHQIALQNLKTALQSYRLKGYDATLSSVQQGGTGPLRVRISVKVA